MELKEFYNKIETPSVLVDYHQLQRNILSVQEKANKFGVSLRPHIKTHKCLEIARMQLEAGAVGITCAKVDEALVFIKEGIPSVTLAYPIIDHNKLDRLIQAVKEKGTKLRCIADSAFGIEVLSSASQHHGIVLDVFLKIDVGLHRCGIPSADPSLVFIANKIYKDPNLHFKGLLSHAGQVYSAESALEAKRIAQKEQAELTSVKEKLEKAGIPVQEVSVGSTPTVLAAENFDGITEIRPGNYVFMDWTPLRLGLVQRSSIALTVLAQVVSKNQDHLIIDAGSKTLSKEKGAHGSEQTSNFGVAYLLEDFEAGENGFNITKLSEEHGFVEHLGRNVDLGTKLRIIPNHSCAVANLTDHYVVIRDCKSFEIWKVDARGCVK